MIIVNDCYDIKQIAESGQVFRMNQIGEHRYGVVSYGKYLELCQIDERTVELFCDELEYEQIWKKYFDLDYDYDRIITQLVDGDDSFLQSAAHYGKGIRILRQEPFEMLISFIISQNKNIPSIKTCIERICRAYGDDLGEIAGKEYYSFPTPLQLMRATKEELREMKLGYRDEYIMAASAAVVEGTLDINMLLECSHEESVQQLKQIKGIGEKVANCVSLYGLHHIDAFPIDVWIKKALTNYYPQGFPMECYKGYAGIIQQYIFYYIRSL